MTKKRVLIITDSLKRQTGYATVAINLIENLYKEFDVAQLGLADVPTDYSKTPLPIDYYSCIKEHNHCCKRGQLIEFFDSKNKEQKYLSPDLYVNEHQQQGICPQGKNLQEDMFGQQSAFFVIQHFKPDIVIAVNDVWGIYHINYLRNRSNFIFIPYLAVDSECFPVRIQIPKGPNGALPDVDTIKFMGANDKTVVFTDWARGVLKKTSRIATNKEPNNIEVIPHGVNTQAFHPCDNRDTLRKEFFNIDENNDVFLIGCVQRNQPRKRMDAIFKTLRILIDKYEKKRKFMVHFHCAIDDNSGWDLPWLAQYYGVVDRCIFDDKLRPGIGVSVGVLNQIMNAYDIHFTLTNSEGWGLPILETMAAGIPNVISDYSAHGDWASGFALKVKLAETYHDIKTNHIKGVADTKHAAKQISLLYNSKEMMKDYRKKSLKRASQLEWSNVCKDWVKLITDTDISKLDPKRYECIVIDDTKIEELPANPIETPFELIEV